MVAAISVAVLDTYPERVSIAVSSLVIGDILTIYRTTPSNNTRVVVRGANAVVVGSDGFVVEDAEQPFGTLITYGITVNGSDVDSDTIYSALSGGKVAISDAINGNAAEVVVTAWPEKNRTRNASTFQVGGRNIVVMGERGQYTSTLEIFTETEDARLNFLNVLDNATSGILQIRQAGTYPGVDAYIAVTGDIEKRWSQDGSDERRTFSLDVAEVGPWADALVTSTSTYEDVANAYSTYADLAAAYSTYLDMAQGDFT